MSPLEEFRRLARTPEREGASLFAEPWHAEVLAIAYALTARSFFSMSEWAEALGFELECAQQSGQPDTEETYYRSALFALERLIAGRSPETAALIGPRVEQWRKAYLATPHGKPVELGAG